MDHIQLWRFLVPTLILQVRRRRLIWPVLKGQGPPQILFLLCIHICAYVLC